MPQESSGDDEVGFVKLGDSKQSCAAQKFGYHAASRHTQVTRFTYGTGAPGIFSPSRLNVGMRLTVHQGNACQPPGYLQLYSACSPESAQTQCRPYENTTTTSCPPTGNP